MKFKIGDRVRITIDNIVTYGKIEEKNLVNDVYKVKFDKPIQVKTKTGATDIIESMYSFSKYLTKIGTKKITLKQADKAAHKEQKRLEETQILVLQLCALLNQK